MLFEIRNGQHNLNHSKIYCNKLAYTFTLFNAGYEISELAISVLFDFAVSQDLGGYP